MNNYKSKFLTILLFSLSAMLSGQLPDGVTATQSYLDMIVSNYNDENSIQFDIENINISDRIPLRVHIIMSKDGSAGVSTSSIINGITIANSYFKNSGIEFFIDSVNYINDYNYSFIEQNYLKKELLTKYSVKSRINLFLADSVKIGSDTSYGFTYFPDQPDSNFIYLDKNYVSGNSLSTMLGHYMGLLSTDETQGGNELADSENCSESGDFICDTYADPGLFNLIDASCRYTGNSRDGTGKYYTPSVANLMSDAPDNCRCVLTPLQYRRIYYYFHKYRQLQ